MRKLKIVTTAALVFGVLLMFSGPFLLGKRPPSAERKELARYGVRMGVLFAAASVSFLISAYGAYRIIKLQREEYRIELLKNVKELVQGSLNDHQEPES